MTIEGGLMEITKGKTNKTGILNGAGRKYGNAAAIIDGARIDGSHGRRQ